jgi:hypothetical protein
MDNTGSFVSIHVYTVRYTFTVHTLHVQPKLYRVYTVVPRGARVDNIK